MTDYDNDMSNYSVGVNRQNEMDIPNRNNYDDNGYRKGTVNYEDGKVLDNYLIQTYGIEYARQHPLK